jgi:hypothetical protein
VFYSFVLNTSCWCSHILPLTTTTNPKMLADWFYTVLRTHENESFYPRNMLYVLNVQSTTSPGYDIRDKHYLTIGVCSETPCTSIKDFYRWKTTLSVFS